MPIYLKVLLPVPLRAQKKPRDIAISRLSVKRRLPTLPLVRSTIGVAKLNFSVRNGKRWNPNAITTLIPLRCLHAGQSNIATLIQAHYSNISTRFHGNESFGLLVLLGFDITALTPVAYQGRSLQPPL